MFLAIDDSIGQTRQSLENKRNQLLKDIQATKTALTKTKNQKQNAFKSFSALQNRITNRKALVQNLNDEISLVDQSMGETLNGIQQLETDIDLLEGEYKALINKAYRIKKQDTWLVFLLSSKGINDAMKRWQYIKQFESYRKRQIKKLISTRTDLEIKQLDLEREISEKRYLLETLQDQNQLLYEEFDRKDKLIKNLNSTEQKLANALEKQEKARKALQQEIERAILVANGGNRGSNVNRPTKNYTGLSQVFYDQRGKMPWPIKNGQVTKFFGKQAHPVVKSIQITNNGIDIKANKSDLNVRVVSSGEIVSLPSIPGLKRSVIIKHGVFFTVYSNLEVLSIQKGQKVEGGNVIGKLSSQYPELHFEVWENTNRLNPVNWLVR